MTSPTPKKNVHELLDSIRRSAEKLGLQSHAGFAMVVAAALDRLLEDAIASKMVPLNSKMRDKIFGDYGTLRGFAAKIDMALGLGVIDQDTYKQLTILRRIRNLFAHTNERLDFSSHEVRKLIEASPGFVASAPEQD